MRDRWVGKNVDLALTSRHVEGFFKSRGFKTKRDKSAKGYRIIGAPNAQDKRGSIIVRIMGNPNDFVIELNASERAHKSIKLGFMTTFFGGGGLLLSSLKKREALERLEREFLVYVDEIIVGLAGSAQHEVDV